MTDIQTYLKLENIHFDTLKSHLFFRHLYLKISTVSQIIYIGLSFYFMTCRKWMFEKNSKKSQKLPVFCHNIKTKP